MAKIGKVIRCAEAMDMDVHSVDGGAHRACHDAFAAVIDNGQETVGHRFQANCLAGRVPQKGTCVLVHGEPQSNKSLLAAYGAFIYAVYGFAPIMYTMNSTGEYSKFEAAVDTMNSIIHYYCITLGMTTIPKMECFKVGSDTMNKSYKEYVHALRRVKQVLNRQDDYLVYFYHHHDNPQNEHYLTGHHYR